MNILMIGVGDAGLDDRSSEPVARHLEYARRIGGHIDLVVDSPRGGDTDYGALTVRRTGTGRLRFPAAAFRLARQAADSRPPDLITTQDPFLTAWAGLWVRNAMRKPLLIQNHSSFLFNKHWLAERPVQFRALHWLARFTLPRADAWRVVNRRERDAYIEKLHLPADRVQVLPVPCDVSPFGKNHRAGQGNLRARWRIPDDVPVVIWAGRPVRFKRLPLLFAAFAEIRARFPSARLVVAGRKELAQEDLDRAAQTHRLDGDALVWTGELAHGELAALFSMADVFVYSSIYEGFGRVLVEAGAAGLPAVSTATAGAADIVCDGETGYLTPLEDARTLAWRGGELIADRKLRARMGAAAREHVRRQFDPARMSAGIVDQWRAVAAENLR
jgi:1,4-alpha-glucan branching enzyme